MFPRVGGHHCYRVPLAGLLLPAFRGLVSRRASISSSAVSFFLLFGLSVWRWFRSHRGCGGIVSSFLVSRLENLGPHARSKQGAPTAPSLRWIISTHHP